MPKRAKPTTHAVIDGSNLATEGRSEPSLAQLREAVAAIHDEFDFTHVTVVVDATFEHRVAKSESKAARKAIDDNEMITPPAGVIGRGDTFILEVADRADAVVFSNDSFQEFHGQYDWLFDDGRLVGGKPVPGVGWVYVARSPVRGPVSRRATSANKRAKSERAPATKKAAASSKSSAPSKSARSSAKSSSPSKSSSKASAKSSKSSKSSTKSSGEPSTSSKSRSRRSGGTGTDGSNDPEVWQAFTEDYPVGTTVAATVDRFSSHGAYGSVDDAVVYLPNRLLGDPPPNKARDVLEVGKTMDFVVHRFDEERFGIDAGLVPAPDAESGKPAKKTAKRSTKKAAAKTASSRSTRKTAKKPAKKTTRKAPAKKATAKKAAAKKTSSRSSKKTAKKPAKKTTKKAPAKKATGRGRSRSS